MKKLFLAFTMLVLMACGTNGTKNEQAKNNYIKLDDLKVLVNKYEENDYKNDIK